MRVGLPVPESVVGWVTDVGRVAYPWRVYFDPPQVASRYQVDESMP